MNASGWLRETRSILLLGFRNAIIRPMLPAIVIIGFIAVVLVMVSVLSIGHGLSNMYTNSGSQDVAIVMSSGAFAEGVSHLNEADVQALGSEPGVAQDAQGPVVSPELVTTELLMAGIAFALLMGFIGGLFPAIRAARLSVAKALRET